ncbi:MAG: hypothetical protein ABII85_01640 [Bacillota bacterium]
MKNKKPSIKDKYVDQRMTILGYKILKKYRKQRTIISTDTIDFNDFDDIFEEIIRLERTGRLKITNQSDEKVEFSITFLGWLEIIRGTIKEFLNLYNAILITVVFISFFAASFTSFVELVKAHESQNAVDVSFYSASIAFYLTVVIIILSIIGISSSRKENIDLIMFKISKELKLVNKKQQELISAITNTKSDNKELVLPALTGIESILNKIAKNTDNKPLTSNKEIGNKNKNKKTKN